MKSIISIFLTASLGFAASATSDEIRFKKSNLRLTPPAGCTLQKDGDTEKYKGRCTTPALTLMVQEMPLAHAKQALEKMHEGNRDALRDVKWRDVRTGKSPAGHARLGRAMSGTIKTKNIEVMDMYDVIEGADGQALMIAMLAIQRSDLKPFMSVAGRLAASIDDIRVPADQQLKISGDAGKCTKTALSDLRHTPAGKDAALAFDTASFTFAKSRLRHRNGDLKIYIASKDWPLTHLGTLPNPVQDEKGGYVTVTLKGNAIAAGSYEAGPGGSSIVKLEISSKDMFAAKNLDPKATLTISAITADKICGSVDFKGMFDGKHTRVRGSFVATR